MELAAPAPSGAGVADMELAAPARRAPRRALGGAMDAGRWSEGDGVA
jgi:hypothetical protein